MRSRHELLHALAQVLVRCVLSLLCLHQLLLLLGLLHCCESHCTACCSARCTPFQH